MAELEIHMEGAEGDPSGKKIGVLAAVIAVLLAVVTILSHRAHADAVVFKAEAGDQWAFYQAKSIKSHALAVGRDLLRALGTATAATEGVHARYEQERKRYEGEAEEIKREALARGAECPHAERQALRYDVGEGLLEIGLVLSSLYFIARRLLFPIVGLVAALVGLAVAGSGFFVP